jgi:uncharacterized membrane protein YuzA (DUF378 family)
VALGLGLDLGLVSSGLGLGLGLVGMVSFNITGAMLNSNRQLCSLIYLKQ